MAAVALLAAVALGTVAFRRRRRALATGDLADRQLSELRSALERLGWQLDPDSTLLTLERRFTAPGRGPLRRYLRMLREHRYAAERAAAAGTGGAPGAARLDLLGQPATTAPRPAGAAPGRAVRPAFVTSARPDAPAELVPGIWRWTADHPGWRPDAAEGSPGDWERAVGCLLCEVGGAAVFIDPLVPADEPAFWRWADARVAAADRCLALTTIGFHRRSREVVARRYGASTSRARAALPEGLESVPLTGAGEVMFWLADRGALICGDRLLGAPGGGVRMCPESWLGYLDSGLTADGLRELLRPLLELPVERVLVSHGEPVLARGREALAEAIG